MYVIIGATGNTGSAVANKLLANGKKVRVVGRNASHLAPFAAKGAEPFTADVTDQSAITKAFAGAEAVYVMIPPDPTTKDYLAYTNQVSETLATAIQNNQVRNAVSLSSVGADKSAKTGPIVALHRFEERLNRISGLNVLHLRPAYFMENTLGQANAIAQMGSTAGPLPADFKFPIIAARDIGDYAAGALSRLDFSAHQVQELHGHRDLSYADITTIIGKAIGKLDLKYSQLMPEQFQGALIQMGMSPHFAGLLSEMSDSMAAGYIDPLQPRSPQNTTPTSYETWVAENLLPIYQKLRPAA